MFISDEEKRQIMEELARGNPEMLIQESSSNLLQGKQKFNDNDAHDSEDVKPTPASKSNNTEEKPDDDSALLSDDTLKVLSQDIIRLLEERLVVKRSKRKVGEVIVRKEIETRIIQVPVRYEKLIVEQVSPERKQLLEINLGQAEVAGIELTEIATQRSARQFVQVARVGGKRIFPPNSHGKPAHTTGFGGGSGCCFEQAQYPEITQ